MKTIFGYLWNNIIIPNWFITITSNFQNVCRIFSLILKTFDHCFS
jgi:hypothetical protein